VQAVAAQAARSKVVISNKLYPLLLLTYLHIRKNELEFSVARRGVKYRGKHSLALLEANVCYCRRGDRFHKVCSNTTIEPNRPIVCQDLVEDARHIFVFWSSYYIWKNKNNLLFESTSKLCIPFRVVLCVTTEE